jgi:hypothetical protein
VTALDAVPFVFPDVTEIKVLCLGLGGGCDAITAYAFSRLFADVAEDVVYGNTKTADVGAVEPVTEHVLRVSGPLLDTTRKVLGRGQCWIDHSVPRAANGSPWIVLLNETGEQQLAGELLSLGFDLLVGIDAGGDSLARKGGRGRMGRDQRMLAVLQRTGLPLLHVVVAPGCDGEASYEDLRAVIDEQVADGRYRGCFALEEMLPIFRAFRGSLGPTRTPQIILAAAEGRLQSPRSGWVSVPRGREPVVPLWWLKTGFVFAPGSLATNGA